MNDWLCDDAIDTPISDCLTSEGEGSQLDNFPQYDGLWPTGSPPIFVPFASWNSNRSYKTPCAITWNKTFRKEQRRAGQSKLGIVLSPKDLWIHILKRKRDEESAENRGKMGRLCLFRP